MLPACHDTFTPACPPPLSAVGGGPFRSVDAEAIDAVVRHCRKMAYEPKLLGGFYDW
jgi:hypothetical protein